MSNLSTKEQTLQLLSQEKNTLAALAAINSVVNTDTQALVAQEIEYLKQLAMTSPGILECIPETVIWCMKSVIKNNLSMDPSAGLVYVKTRSVNLGTQKEPVWKKSLEVIPSANGILSVAYQCGKILDHKSPVVRKDANGKVIEVDFEFQLPTGRWEVRTFDESDFFRWQRASHKENGRNKADANAETMNYANDHYISWRGGIDPEFARAKAIRHGLKKLGTNPNEKYANKIVPGQLKVIEVDPEMDRAATYEEGITDIQDAVYVVTHEVVASKTNSSINDLNL